MIERSRDGDEEALRELLRRHGGSIRGTLAGQIPRRFRSLLSEDDLTQEVFTLIYLGIPRFVSTGPGAFSAWVRVLTRNALRDAIRALETEKRGGKHRRVELPVDESMESLYLELAARSLTSPSSRASRNEAVDRMKEALEGLPEAYREVVESYDLRHRPIEEVAKELERSPGAAYLLRNRALKRLGEMLGFEEGRDV